MSERVKSDILPVGGIMFEDQQIIIFKKFFKRLHISL